AGRHVSRAPREQGGDARSWAGRRREQGADVSRAATQGRGQGADVSRAPTQGRLLRQGWFEMAYVNSTWYKAALKQITDGGEVSRLRGLGIIGECYNANANRRNFSLPHHFTKSHFSYRTAN